MAHTVFISHSHVDKAIADAICANLEAANIRCWVAPRDIAPGQDWPTAIANAISTSRIMVLVFSESSNKSEDVGRELILAANSGLIIIPFKIDNIAPIPGKQYYLARTHWLDALNPPTQDQIDRLVGYIRSFIVVEAGSAEPARPEPEAPIVRREVAAKRERQAPLSKRARQLWVGVAAALVLMVLAGGSLFVSRQATEKKQATGTALAERSTGTQQTHNLFSTATEEAQSLQLTQTSLGVKQMMTATEQARKQKMTVTQQARDMHSTATRQALLATPNFLDGQAIKMYTISSGSLYNNEANNLVEIRYSGVMLRDLIAEATFYNPYPVTSTDKWDYGFVFRDAYSNNQFRLVITSGKTWSLENGYTNIDNGSLINLNTGADQSNKIKLYCDGNKGWLFVNGDIVTELDLSARTIAGDVGVAIGLFNGDELTGKYTSYKDFVVWKVP